VTERLEGEVPLFGPGSRGGKVATVARKTPAVDPVRPVWTRLTVKVPPACFACVRRLHDEWGTGVDFIPARRARWRRRQGDVIEDFCGICGEEMQEQEKKDAAAAKLAAQFKPKPTNRRRQQFKKGSA
jgi:hypothetical protein